MKPRHGYCQWKRYKTLRRSLSGGRSNKACQHSRVVKGEIITETLIFILNGNHDKHTDTTSLRRDHTREMNTNTLILNVQWDHSKRADSTGPIEYHTKDADTTSPMGYHVNHADTALKSKEISRVSEGSSHPARRYCSRRGDHAKHTDTVCPRGDHAKHADTVFLGEIMSNTSILYS